MSSISRRLSVGCCTVPCTVDSERFAAANLLLLPLLPHCCCAAPAAKLGRHTVAQFTLSLCDNLHPSPR
jgi:hypothetical protein